MRFIVGTRAAESVEAAKRLASDLSRSGIEPRLLEQGLLSTNFWHRRYEVRGLVSPELVGGDDRYAVLDVFDHVHGVHRAAEVIELVPRPGFDPVRFSKEAAALARVRHPMLPQLVELLVDVDAEREIAVAVLVMERLLGANLETVVRTNGPLAPEHVGWMMADVLTALSALHKAGLMHGDVQPKRLVLGVDAVVRLVDLGRVGVAACDGPYAAPEVATGDGDRRDMRSPAADLYALALTILALVTGREPAQLPRVLQGADAGAVDVERAVPGVVRSTRALLQRMLTLDPRARPSSALKVRSALGTHASAPRPAAVTVDAITDPSLRSSPRSSVLSSDPFKRARVPSAPVVVADLRKIVWHAVSLVTFEARPGWSPDLEVRYWDADLSHIVSELLQPTGPTFAAWWRARGGRAPVPRSADDAQSRASELARVVVRHVALLVDVVGTQRLHAIDLGDLVIAPVTAEVLEVER